MIETIKEHIASVQAFTTQNAAELEAFRIQYLGSKGLLKDFFAEFKNVPNEQKKEFGQVINLLKTSAEEKVKAIQEELESKQDSKGIYGDITRLCQCTILRLGEKYSVNATKRLHYGKLFPEKSS